jgi:hypothetical protein
MQMDDEAVRDQARAFADALAAGDVDAAIGSFSQELRRNLGEVLALFPLPANEATVESVEHGGSGYNVAIRLQGETEEVQVLTRWKVRDGQPTIVEASHQSRTAREAETGAEESEGSAAGEA